MRTLLWTLLPALAALWGWFALEVAPGDARRPVPVAIARGAEPLSAEVLNNQGVALDRAGRRSDALAYFERARDFRPHDPVLVENVARARHRVERVDWLRFLLPASAFALILSLFGAVRAVADRARLRRLRTRGESYVRILPDDVRAEIPLRFNAPVERLFRRHPLTIVWSSAGEGRHMKSRPPVVAKGTHATVRLEGERVARLLRHPGDWRAFLYVGDWAVGEAAARVG